MASCQPTPLRVRVCQPSYRLGLVKLPVWVQPNFQRHTTRTGCLLRLNKKLEHPINPILALDMTGTIQAIQQWGGQIRWSRQLGAGNSFPEKLTGWIIGNFSQSPQGCRGNCSV